MQFRIWGLGLATVLAGCLATAATAEAGGFQDAYVKASNTGAGDRFGDPMALDGDTMVVGAPDEDSNASGVDGDQAADSAAGSGAAYVFTRDSTGEWTQQAYLKASNPDAGDRFGASVALDGDTIVIGAYLEDGDGAGGQADNSTEASGAAYVFNRTGATWSQQAYLKASNPGLGDVFGVSVAIADDTIVVGAQGEDGNGPGGPANNSAEESGAAYVYTRTGASWSQQAYLKASSPVIAAIFGDSVAISGDTIAVGAWGEGEGGYNSGAAYVYTRAGAAWTEQAHLKASNAGANHRFGDSIAIDGDTTVVGAPTEGRDIYDDWESGAAYVFTRSAETRSQQAYLKATNVGRGDKFGESVAIDGDNIVVGATGEDGNGIGGPGDNSVQASGAAYAFIRRAGTWFEHGYLKAAAPGVTDRFGASVAIDGETIALGAPNEDGNATGVNGSQADNSASDSGAAYIFAIDLDGDGVRESEDNCPSAANPAQEDRDGDTLGNACDPDDDNDGKADGSDACPRGEMGWTSTADTDRDDDGCRDAGEDMDDDNDGVADHADACPNGAGPGPDTDRDGCKDVGEDSDDDNDGKADAVDACPTVAATTADGCPDRTAPKVKLTSGPSGKTKDRTPTFRFKSNDATAKFSCSVDRARPGRCKSPFTSKKLKPGKHRFKVVATDAAANRSAPETRSFTVKKKRR
jgi:hypothetical protein